MNLTASQRSVIRSCLSLVETGKLPSVAAYSEATILPDGAGISFGSKQFTAASSLMAVLRRYEELDGLYSARLRVYEPQIPLSTQYRGTTSIPPWLSDLLELLRASGADPKMRTAQDDVFDRLYLQPSLDYAEALGLHEALSALAIVDCAVQSGLGRVATLRPTFAARPPSAGGSERLWTAQFIRARHDWLSRFVSVDTRKQKLVRSTTYRTAALLELVAADAWALETPLVFRSVRITG